MALVNLGNLLNLVIGDANRGFLTTFTNALCTTITSRILLNLRDPELQGGTLAIGRWSIPGTSLMAVTRSMAFTDSTTVTTQRTEDDCALVPDNVTISVESRVPPTSSPS
ncbi:hypothetical protein BD311DRAFT_781644 [Dichomitus squalens]|uniref:Uncharacterized protein n=1 Tax=Dichomitus squalens TaxID=114155 RepID=A0A4Q9M8P4_9APHY|nr:hypothetical protein BD311DRAFT_781644 [Dichomitus squalens]